MSGQSTRRRWVTTLLGATGTAAVFLACTITQSLDYLTKGGGEGAPDVVSEDPTVVPEGGAVQNILVPNQTKPGLLAQDTGALYWASADGVFSVAKTGGTPKLLGMAPAATGLAVDPDPNGAVFLTVGRDVMRLPKSGTGGGKIFTGAASAPLAAWIAVDDTALFVLQYDDVVAESYLLRMAKDGKSPSNLAGDAGLPSAMAIDSKNVFWLDTAAATSAFYDLPKAAAPAMAKVLPLAADDDGPDTSEKLTSDDTTFFWATDGLNGVPGVFSRKREAAASTIAVFRGDTETFGAIAIDATNVYVIETSAGSILRVPKQGGTAATLLTKLAGPKGLVVDDTSYYVTVEATGSTGYILKMKK